MILATHVNFLMINDIIIYINSKVKKRNKLSPYYRLWFGEQSMS